MSTNPLVEMGSLAIVPLPVDPVQHICNGTLSYPITFEFLKEIICLRFGVQEDICAVITRGQDQDNASILFEPHIHECH
jgi:hypothetical protein